MPIYISTEEAAGMSGYYTGYIRRLARTGKIKAEKKAGVWWVYRDDLARYVEEMKALGPEKFNWHRIRTQA